VVRSSFATAKDAQDAQRTRWEHGHLDTLMHGVPRLLATALKRRHWPSLALALDLAVPPLALLVLGLSGVFTLAAAWAAWAALGGTVGAVMVSGLGLAAVALAVVLAWARFGRDLVPAHTLLAVPWYTLRKLSMYLRFVVARQTKWVRSQRDGER
jgi:hypothetical protein